MLQFFTVATNGRSGSFWREIVIQFIAELEHNGAQFSSMSHLLSHLAAMTARALRDMREEKALIMTAVLAPGRRVVSDTQAPPLAC
jgi:hypothetical protein